MGEDVHIRMCSSHANASYAFHAHKEGNKQESKKKFLKK